jgi:hypothetical protein
MPDDVPTPEWEWEDVNTTADAPATPKLTVLHANEAMQEEPPVEIVEGVAWAGCVTVLVAESSAGKTFVALDLAAAISAGIRWHGRDTTQGTVVHIGYEGDAIGLRLRALREHRQARLEHVYRVRAADPLSPTITRDGEQRATGERDVVQALRGLASALSADERPPIALVIIDTVRASLSGSEDGSESVSAYLRAVRRILDAFPSAAALLVHHAGWQDGDAAKKRERGSSAFRGNVDATLYLEAGPYDPQTESAPLTLTTHKVRDGEKPPPVHMVRQRVTFTDTDQRGKARTSCVIDGDSRTAADHAAERHAKADAASAADDRRVLTTIQRHPHATARATLRQLAGIGKDNLDASIVRLLQLGWIDPPEKQRQPYTLTPLGRQALAGPLPTESDSDRPGD